MAMTAKMTLILDPDLSKWTSWQNDYQRQMTPAGTSRHSVLYVP